MDPNPQACFGHVVLLDVVCRGPKELGGPEGQRPSWTTRRTLQQNITCAACAGDVFA